MKRLFLAGVVASWPVFWLWFGGPYFFVWALILVWCATVLTLLFKTHVEK